MKVKKYLFSILLILFVALSGCTDTNKNPEKDRLKIITTLFPLYDFAKNVAGERAEVTLLLPPGVEAHSFEPKPGDILKINRSDIFIYTGKFMEPWAEDIIKGIDNKNILVVDASKGIKFRGFNKEKDRPHEHKHSHKEHFHSDMDPHIWLDLQNATVMVDNISSALVKKDPSNRDYYEKNAKQYKTRIMELDERYKNTLSICKKRIIVHGGHFAFGYLARRYNLEYVSAYRGAPNSEPTAKTIAEMKRIVNEKNIKYVFFEELITPRVAEILAKETGAKLLKLHGCHNISKEEMDRGVTFLSLMEENLNSLKIGLECQ